MNGYFTFFFFNMYIMPGEEIFLALWLLGPMAPSKAEFHRTQPLRKTWCCTSDTLRSVLAREYLDPSASGGLGESVLQAHQSMTSVASLLIHPVVLLSFK